jgi:hypothetical protein
MDGMMIDTVRIIGLGVASRMPRWAKDWAQSNLDDGLYLCVYRSATDTWDFHRVVELAPPIGIDVDHWQRKSA